MELYIINYFLNRLGQMNPVNIELTRKLCFYSCNQLIALICEFCQCPANTQALLVNGRWLGAVISDWEHGKELHSLVRCMLGRVESKAPMIAERVLNVAIWFIVGRNLQSVLDVIVNCSIGQWETQFTLYDSCWFNRNKILVQFY